MALDFKNASKKELKAEYKRIANEMGDDRFFTKKELNHLPSILSDGEQVLAFSSGVMNGNTWLITLTDRRILFLDKGMIYGLKQTSIDLDKINAIGCETGIFFGKIMIEDGATERKIETVLKQTVIKFTNKVRDAMEVRKRAYSGNLAHHGGESERQRDQEKSAPEPVPTKKESSLFLNICKWFMILFFLFILVGVIAAPNEHDVNTNTSPQNPYVQNASGIPEANPPVSVQATEPSVAAPMPSPSISVNAQALPAKMAPTATNIYGGKNGPDTVPVPQDAPVQNNPPIPAVTEPPVVASPQSPDPVEEQKKQHDEAVKKELGETRLMVSSCNAAQRAVKTALIAPSTAKFPSCGWSLEEHTFRISDDKKLISVNGYVDSQNTFGAMLRKKWVVVLERDNEDHSENPHWAVIGLAFD